MVYLIIKQTSIISIGISYYKYNKKMSIAKREIIKNDHTPFQERP
jgi:hypothetical protein